MNLTQWLKWFWLHIKGKHYDARFYALSSNDSKLKPYYTTFIKLNEDKKAYFFEWLYKEYLRKITEHELH